MISPLDKVQLDHTPRKTTISRLTASLLGDGRRVKVIVVFQDLKNRPDLELVLEDAQGRELARSLLMEIIANSTEFTLHIREASTQPPYKVTAFLKEESEQVVSTLSIEVN